VHDALLTGLLYCGECGQRMTTSGIRHRRMYQCRNRPERPGCGRVAVSASLADAEIAGAVLDTIDQPEVLAAIGARADDPSAALSEQLQRDRAALERLAVDHYTGRLSEREFAAARPALLSQISDAEAALARNTSSRSIARLAGVDVRSEWELRDHDWQRSVVRLLVARVDCARARQPYNTWQPDRLSVTATYGAAEETGDLGDQGGVAELR
jgi:hypothetical protein